MNAVSLWSEVQDHEEAPPTERAPASGLARLVACTRRDVEEDTLSRAPTIDLIALATGADDDAIARMRALYARGDAAEALAVADSIRLVVDDADILEIDSIDSFFMDR